MFDTHVFKLRTQFALESYSYELFHKEKKKKISVFLGWEISRNFRISGNLVQVSVSGFFFFKWNLNLNVKKSRSLSFIRLKNNAPVKFLARLSSSLLKVQKILLIFQKRIKSFTLIPDLFKNVTSKHACMAYFRLFACATRRQCSFWFFEVFFVI